MVERGGNVGINTNDPVAYLHVNGNVLIGDQYEAVSGGLWSTSTAQFVLGGSHNAGYNTSTKAKLVITGYDNETTTYPFYVEDENGNVDFYIKCAPATNGNLGTAQTFSRGPVYLGNSDIYFTKTNHDHSGVGNTSGYAAIENASNFGCLMILGRYGTSHGRNVEI